MSNLKESTIKLYERSINKIKNNYCSDLTKLNVDKLFQELSDDNYKLNTQKTICSALIYYYTKLGNYNNLILQLKNKNKNIAEIVDYNIRQNKLSNAELKKYVPWNIILDIYNHLSKLPKIDHIDSLIYFVILSLYVKHPPRRLNDYVYMYIDDNKEIVDDINILWNNKKDWDKKYVELFDTKNLSNKNYYVRTTKGNFFIFENYKTSKKYGRQYIEVNDELNTIINNYIFKYNLKSGDKLFNFDYDTFKRYLRRIFKIYVNREISASMLRHIYINYEYKNHIKCEQDRFILSRFMSHNLPTQGRYRKIVSDNFGKDVKINTNFNKRKTRNVYKTDEERKLARQRRYKIWYQKNKEKINARRKEKRLIKNL